VSWSNVVSGHQITKWKQWDDRFLKTFCVIIFVVKSISFQLLLRLMLSDLRLYFVSILQNISISISLNEIIYISVSVSVNEYNTVVYRLCHFRLSLSHCQNNAQQTTCKLLILPYVWDLFLESAQPAQLSSTVCTRSACTFKVSESAAFWGWQWSLYQVFFLLWNRPMYMLYNFSDGFFV